MSKVSWDAIRAVRARVERSVPECKAALERTGGDVEAAVASLMRPLERRVERTGRVFGAVRNATLDDEAAPPLPAPANEIGHARVIEDFGKAIAARKAWTGEPSRAGLEAVRARFEERHGPLPAALGAFLARWNGVELDASTYLWACEGCDHDAIDSDDPNCADAWVFGELRDAGYLFLHATEIWFCDHDGQTFRVAPNFESFLRDVLNADLRVFDVVERQRPR